MNRLEEVLDVIDLLKLTQYLQREDKKKVNAFVSTFIDIATSITLGIGAVDSQINAIKETIALEKTERKD